MDGENVTAQGIDEMCEDGQRGERKGQSILRPVYLIGRKLVQRCFPHKYMRSTLALSLSIFLPAKQYDSHV